MRSKLNQPWVEATVVLVLYLLALSYGLRPLDDTDLGGHIAAGLWILDTHHLPTLDPFGAQGNYWLCYSWLAELPMGIAYKLGAFAAVKLLKVLFVFAMTASLIWLARSLHRRNQGGVAPYLGESLTMVAVVPLILPLCHLRPQVISFVFFALLVALADRDQLRAKYLVPMTVIWASVHVYWLLVPLVVFVHEAVFPRAPEIRQRARGSLLALGYTLLAIVNPYTWRLYVGVWDYVFAHQAADAMISELTPFAILQYQFFWLYAVIVLAAVVSFRSLLRRERLGHLALFAAFAIATLNRFRYLPLFAIAAAPIVRTMLAALAERFPASEPAAERPPESLLRWVCSPAAALAFLVPALLLIDAQPLLPRPHRELFDVARRLQRDYPVGAEGSVNVVTNASDGPWLILAFWLTRPPGAGATHFKVAMDTRTLLMGQQRVREYDDLRQMKPDWPDILRAWNIAVVVLPSRATILQALTSERAGDRLGHWSVFTRTSLWTVLVRQRRNREVPDRPVGDSSSEAHHDGARRAFSTSLAMDLVRVVV